MLARIALLGVASAAATSTITLDCNAAGTKDTSALLRITDAGAHTDYWLACDDAGAVMINNVAQTMITVPDTATATFVNRVGTQFDAMGTAAACAGVEQICQFAVDENFAVGMDAQAGIRNTIFDCSDATMAVGGFLFNNNDGAKTAGVEAEDTFSCSPTAVTLPTALDTAMMAFKPATAVGLFAISNEATSEKFTLTSNGMNDLFVDAPLNKVLGSEATSTCLPNTLITTEGCEIVDGTMGAFNVVLEGGAVAAAKPAEVVPCTFKCTSVGNVAGAGCTSSSSTTTASLCQGQATTVVTTPCVEGRAQGEVFCFPKATAVNFAQADFDAVVAAFVTAPNSNAAFFSFIGVLRAQAFTFAFGTTCVACVVETLSSGGFILCADCGVLLAGAAAARQGTGVRVVICGTAGNTEAERTACLEAAACAGALESAACFRAGVAVPCPLCTANLETTSSSKKGLLGLLGLLAIIPAVLLLCSSILCCCLLLRRRKRAVPPPVIPTVAPMTSVCEPVVCGGTIGAAPMGCSPYGSAYPVM